LGIIRGPIDLGSDLTKSDEDILDFHMGVRAIADRCVLKELGEEKGVTADTLYGLSSS